MSWPPLEQDWDSSNVRGMFTDPLPEPLPPAEEPDPKTWTPAEPEHAKTRTSILTKASAHIQQALIELNEAVAWFSIVDPKDQSELVRRVEQLADTIEYRASLK